MHLKRFRGQTVAEALEAARAALGPKALVLGTQLVPRRGWRGTLGAREVEVTAAVEREVSVERPARQADRHPGQPSVAALRAQLCASGLDGAVADEVAAHLRGRRGASSADVRRALAAWSTAICPKDADESPIDVFVGPAGAGKTTTVAKIAARARVTTGQRLALVSTDTFRVGAIEQLKLYSEIIGSPFVAARTAGELAAALAPNTTRVLVDTAGRSPRDGHAQELMSLIAKTPQARVHVVVPAGISVAELVRVIDGHAAVAPKWVVFTKVDEGGSIAPLAGELRRRDLRVSYLGTGQRVPEDLHVATPAAIAATLVGDSLLAPGHAA